jgi:NAD-dependent deacetylase
VEDLATPEGFAADPEAVWEWYGMRIGQILEAKPNAAHHAIAVWADRAQDLTLITSNVDDLHERAGSHPVHKLHGRILEGRCTVTSKVFPLLRKPDGIPSSPEGNPLRPNVVWFGEQPWQEAVRAAQAAIPAAYLVVEVGVSGVVTYGFTEWALRLGKPVLRINPEPRGHAKGLINWPCPAASALPELVSCLVP